MTEQDMPYPYNLPPWRRSFELASPDGAFTAKIHEAWELNMSGPTYGKLFVGDIFRIENCSPTFVWSDDSRYLAVPKWGGFFLRRERLLVLDTVEKKNYVSRKKYGLLVLDRFEGGIISATNSPAYKPKKIEVSMEEVVSKFKLETQLLQGSSSPKPNDD